MFAHESEHGIAEEHRPRRWRFRLQIFGVPLLLVGLAVVVWIVVMSSGLRRAIAEADAQDPGWRLEDLEKARFTPPPGQNAAERVVAVAKLLQGGGAGTQYDLLWDLDPLARLNGPQTAALQAILQAAGPPALAAARTLIDTPRGRHAILWSPDAFSTLLKCQDNRDTACLLYADALDRAQAGDLAGAVAACHAAFHAGSSLGDEPTALSQLVRVAIQWLAVRALEGVLAQGEPPADRLAALQARIEAEESAPLLLYAARGERANLHLLFESLRNGTVPVLPSGMLRMHAVVLGGRGGGQMIDVMTHVPGFLTSQHIGYLHYMNELVEIARRPPEEWDALMAQQRLKLPDPPVIVGMLAPGMANIAQTCQRNHAMLRSTIVALAAERFRQQHGHWPAAPDELVQAGLLRAVPIDPFDGQPIRLARTADGLVVYSVGPNKVDDGGTIDRQDWMKAGTDLGFQLWDPQARRQPTPPPPPPKS